MLVGHGSAWTEIGKTLNMLYGGNHPGFTLDFSGVDFSNLDFGNLQTEAQKAEEKLNDSIARAQAGADGPIDEVAATAVVDTGLARNPDGSPIAATPSSDAMPQNRIETATGSEAQPVTETGTVDYDTRVVGALPEEKDPDKAFAEVAKARNQFVRSTVRPFEEAMIGQLDSDELIQQAPVDAYNQSVLSEDIARRNLSRFGVAETRAARMQRATGNQLVRTIGVTDAVNNARLQQDTSNQELLNTLVNAAQGINKTALESLGTAAGLQIGRENAYSSARAASRSQRYGFFGSVLGML